MAKPGLPKRRKARGLKQCPHKKLTMDLEMELEFFK